MSVLGANVRTLTDHIPGPDGPRPLLILDQRPLLAIRADPAEQADPVFAALLGMGLSLVTTISEPASPAMLTAPPDPAPGWRLELSRPRAARLTAPDGTLVYDGECAQAPPWCEQMAETGQCAVLIGAVGLFPTEQRPFTWMETLLGRAAQAEELVGGLVAATC